MFSTTKFISVKHAEYFYSAFDSTTQPNRCLTLPSEKTLFKVSKIILEQWSFDLCSNIIL